MRRKVFNGAVIACALVVLLLTVFLYAQGKFFEAIAVSGVGSVMLWLLLQAVNRARLAREDTPPEEEDA